MVAHPVHVDCRESDLPHQAMNVGDAAKAEADRDQSWTAESEIVAKDTRDLEVGNAYLHALVDQSRVTQGWRADHADSRFSEIAHDRYRDLKFVDDPYHGHHGDHEDDRVQSTDSSLGKDAGLKAHSVFGGSNMIDLRLRSANGRCVQMSLAVVLYGLPTDVDSDAYPLDQMVVRHFPVGRLVHMGWAEGFVPKHLALAHAVPMLCLGWHAEAVTQAVHLCSVYANEGLANC